MKIMRILPIVLIFVLLLGGCGEDPNRFEFEYNGADILIDFDLGRAFVGDASYTFYAYRDRDTGRVTDVSLEQVRGGPVSHKELKALILDVGSRLPEPKEPINFTGIGVIFIGAVAIIGGLIMLFNPEGWWDFTLALHGSWQFKNRHMLEASDAGLAWVRVRGGIFVFFGIFVALFGLFYMMHPL